VNQMTEKGEVKEWMRVAAQEIYERFIEWKAFNPEKDDRIVKIIAAHCPVEQARKLDGKFSIQGSRIVNTVSGEPIPEDEPLFLLRGRDENAIAGLNSYLNICHKRGCNDLHQRGILQTLDKFTAFKNEHPERMKQPGITKHLKLEAGPVEQTSRLFTEPILEKLRKRAANLREALVAAVPFLFEHGHHFNDRCYKYRDDMTCHCGLDEAKQLVSKALETWWEDILQVEKLETEEEDSSDENQTTS
jgi:hypothetical protein